MHADLMRTPGQNMHVQKRRVFQVFQQRPLRHRLATGGVHSHALAVLCAAGDGLFHPPGRLAHAPVHHGQIMLFHRARAQLVAQALMRQVVFGHHEKAAGILVQPVHDAGPLHPANAAEILHVIEQGVDQRAAFIARGGMHHHAARLDHHGQVRILIEDFKRDVLLLHGRFPGVGHGQLQRVSRGNLEGGLLARRAVDQAQPLLNPPGRLRPAGSAHLRRQQVQTRLFPGYRRNLLHMPYASFQSCGRNSRLAAIIATPAQMAISATLHTNQGKNGK